MLDILRLPDEYLRAVVLRLGSDRWAAKFLGVSKALHSRFAAEFKQRRRQAVEDLFSCLFDWRDVDDDEEFFTDAWKRDGDELRFKGYLESRGLSVVSNLRVVMCLDYIRLYEEAWPEFTDGWGHRFKYHTKSTTLIYPHSRSVWANYDLPRRERPIMDGGAECPVLRMIVRRMQ